MECPGLDANREVLAKAKTVRFGLPELDANFS